MDEDRWNRVKAVRGTINRNHILAGEGRHQAPSGAAQFYRSARPLRAVIRMRW
ncbi:hypothetical protein [Gemmobacter sp. 24YEA27]|uniref:hypothetical protein n=1 Tax=Gemmobacter sp. 24YEA27 TaxID=3040672 RepID=UPI0024B38191|nr:hypothetical protein [Gemmobacter sp. 24YEA27]